MALYNIKSIISKKPGLGLILPRLDILPFYPLFLLTHITLSCDQKCSWCYQGDHEFYSLHNKNMELGVFEKILSGFKFFKPHIHIYGGEPLLHPDFPLFLEYSRLYGYKPTLTTNGSQLSKYSAAIIKSSLSQLNISLNGLIGPNGSILSRPADELAGFLNANRGAKEINLNYVIEPESHNYLEDIVLHFNRSCQKGSFSYFAIQHFMTNGTCSTGQEKDFNARKLSAIFSRLKKMSLKFRIIFLPNIKAADLGSYYGFKDPFRNKCYVPWLGLSVYPDSTVTPGGGILGCNFVLGNLNKSSVRQIWEGEGFYNFRRSLARNSLPGICNRCCHKLYY